MARKSPKAVIAAPKAAPPAVTKAKPAARRVARQRAAPPAAAGKSTKANTVLTALQRPAGASLAELVAATGWQAHSVRGFLSGTVRKKLGLDLTVQQADGERRYHLAA